MFLILFLTSCSERYENIRSSLMVMEPHLSQYNAVIVIPGEGCGGCISGATAYINLNPVGKDTLVVFTGIKDLKLLKFQLVESFFERPNVLIDHESSLNDIEELQIYPKIILLKGNDISDIGLYSPSF